MPRGLRAAYNAASCGPVAQRLEQGTHNPLVQGSNPCGPTIFLRWLWRFAVPTPQPGLRAWHGTALPILQAFITPLLSYTFPKLLARKGLRIAERWSFPEGHRTLTSRSWVNWVTGALHGVRTVHRAGVVRVGQ